MAGRLSWAKRAWRGRIGSEDSRPCPVPPSRQGAGWRCAPRRVCCGEQWGWSVWAPTVYDANDPVENQRQTRDVAALLRNAGMDPYEANTLALLGGLPGTNGQALRQAARAAAPGQAVSFDHYRLIALAGGGQRIVGSNLTVAEAYARMAAMGYDPSTPPVAFHCVEDGCHARAQLMIDGLQLLGLKPDQIRRVWAFSERAFGLGGPRMRPTTEGGSPLRDYTGAVIDFDYHVAPAVFVEGPGGSPVLQVLDPSLVGRPVEGDVWHHCAGTPLHRPRAAQITDLGPPGQPPVQPASGNPFSGSGYRPWADPQPMTASQDAEALMIRLMAADANLGRPPRPLPPL